MTDMQSLQQRKMKMMPGASDVREEAEKRLFSLEKRGSRGNLSMYINT